MGRYLPTLVAALLISATIPVLGSDAPSSEALETATARKASIPRTRLLDGTVEAVNQSTIAAQTGGQITEVLFDVDDFVEKGTEIVRLKDSDQKAQLAQAQADLNAAQAQLDESKEKFDRAEKVFAQKVISKAEMDQITAGMKSAVARKEAAEASVNRAEEELAHTRIRAPYTGIVTRRHVEIGEIASPGTPLMGGVSLEKLRVTVNVPQTIIGAIRDNGKVYVLAPNQEQPVEATELTIFPYADQGSNTFKVRIELPEKTIKLFPGMFVKVAFSIGTTQAVVVPVQSVVKRSELTGIYTVNSEGKPSLRMIRTGALLADGNVIVLSGLEDGETIATNPVAAGILTKQAKRKESRHE